MSEQGAQGQITSYQEGSGALYRLSQVGVVPAKSSPPMPMIKETAPRETSALFGGKYLYCIFRCADERTFNEVAAIGDPGLPVHAVCYDSLAAVVSDSPMERYESTRSNLLAHERVIECVMRESGVLPVKFGTVAKGSTAEQDIQKLLQVRFQEFSNLLTEMEDKVELGLKALRRDENLIFEEILSQDQAIRRLRNSIQGKPPPATHFERIRLGRMVKEAMDRKRSAEAAVILTPLRQVARRSVENPILLDMMLVNSAFLVDKSREEEFDRAVSGLDQELGERIRFKYIGPVPPYNFVNITVNWEEVLKSGVAG